MITCSRRGQALLLIASAYALNQALFAADYIGGKVCGECHNTEYEKESVSHHAESLRPIQASLLGANLLKTAHSPDDRLTYEQGQNGIVVRVVGGPETAILEWAFGAGVQGSTPVGRLRTQYFEHQYSYYARFQGLAPTFGHPPHPNTPVAELGILQDEHTIFRCFNCHATGVQETANGPDLQNMMPGVQCERCHGPGSAHVKAARDHLPGNAVRREILNPGRVPARSQIEICGQCHRLGTPGLGDQPELAEPVTVRFAPIGLLASRCFRATGKLSCLLCHDPHADVRTRADMAYTERCVICHANGGPPIKSCRRASRQNCLPCHMKQTSLGPYLTFTDHRIRVY